MEKSMISYIIIIGSQVMAYIIIILGGKMMDAGTIGIIVALVGVAGGIWTQVVQFKKDAQRIEGVNNTASSVKNDTTEMKPKVENIERSTNIIRDDISRTIIPNINNMSKIGDNVSELLEAKRIEDKFKERVSPALGNPEYIKGAVDLIYEQNAKLEMRIVELVNDGNNKTMQIQTLEQENDMLREANTNLITENIKLKNQINHITKENDMGDMSR